MFVRDYEKPLLEYSSFRLHKYLLAYVPPVLLLVGTVGNVLSIIILTRKSLRKYSTYFYLAVLAGADTLVLYVGLLRLWVGELTGKDVRDQSDWTCKSISVLGYTLSDYSGWLIIAVTIERYLAVCRPLKAPSGSAHRKRAYKVVVVLFIFLFCINAHFFWTVNIGYISHGNEAIAHCKGGLAYKRLIDDVWPWVDTIIYSFLPFLIILTLNALIIRQVVRARRDRRILQTPGSRPPLPAGPLHSHGNYTHTSPADSGGKITVMLMSISFTFLLTTLPVTIANITARFLEPYITDLPTMITFRLVRTVIELLMYTNHCINFFLYCATGQKFRKQFVWMLPPGRGTCGGHSTQYERRFSCYPPGLNPGGAGAQSDYSLWQATQTNGVSRNTSRHLLPLSELMVLHPPPHGSRRQSSMSGSNTTESSVLRSSTSAGTRRPLLGNSDNG